MGCCCDKAWTDERADSREPVWYPAFLEALPTLEEKIVAVTGCTSGTGFHLALGALQKGATVIMLNRPSARQEAAYAKLTESVPNAKLSFVPCDLTSFESTRAAAAALTETYGVSGIDVLCCNAGIMAWEDIATGDGYDVQMQTNHLSHFLLCQALFPLLETAAKSRTEARIVFHSSLARHGKPLASKYFGKNGGDLGGNSASMFCGGARWERYHQTKLANITCAQALHQRLAASTSAVKAVCAAPGLATTHLQTSTSKNGGMSETWIMKYAQSAPDGAMPIMHCCFGTDVQSGEMYEPTLSGHSKGPVGKVTIKPGEKDPASMKMLWEQSEAACGVKFL